MESIKTKLYGAFQSIQQQFKFNPKIGIICGSGLGDMAERIESVYSIPFQQIKNMPKSTVEGHDGRFVFGYIDTVPVVVMQGRVHYYEGYAPSDVVLPIRLMKLMGAEYLFITNAAGGITYTNPGDLMLINDHISTFVPSPLRGKNIDSLGTRFPDMSQVYDKDLINLAKDVALKLDINVKEGVYMQFPGPQYETPAEVNMAKMMGADAVGMSTAIEAIAAVHAGMKVVGLSCISNPAAGISKEPLNHIDVQKSIKATSEKIIKLGREFIIAIKKQNRWN